MRKAAETFWDVIDFKKEHAKRRVMRWNLDLFFFLAVPIAFFFGGIVKGVVGMGLPLVALALMTTVLDLKTAVSLVVFPIIMTNICPFDPVMQIQFDSLITDLKYFLMN